MTRKNANFVGFTSALGGIGTTSLAVTYGDRLSEDGLKVVYVSFDFLSNKCVKSSDIKRANLYDLYYETEGSSALLLFGEPGEPIDYDKLLVKDDFGMYYFTFKDLVNPLHMKAECLDKLFVKLSLSFDFVIVDVPSNCIYGVDVLPYCDDVVEVFAGDEKRQVFCDDHFKFYSGLCRDSVFHKYTFKEANDFSGVMELDSQIRS